MGHVERRRFMRRCWMAVMNYLQNEMMNRNDVLETAMDEPFTITLSEEPAKPWVYTVFFWSHDQDNHAKAILFGSALVELNLVSEPMED